MTKSRLFTLVGLAVFCVIILLPPIIHGYVYPNIGDDTAVTLEMLDLMAVGDLSQVRYLGHLVVGYPLIAISRLTEVRIDALYLWYSFIMLACVGLAIYWTVSRLTNGMTGWLALLLSLFGAQGLLFLFYYGQLFNVINIGIIFPLLTYFAVRYLTERRAYQLTAFSLLALLYVGFHTSGIYLPAMAGLALAGYVGYCVVTRHKPRHAPVIMGSSVVVLGLLAFSFLVLAPTISVLEKYALLNEMNVVNIIRDVMGFSVLHYMMDIWSPSLFAVGAVAVGYGVVNTEGIPMLPHIKTYCAVVGAALVVLGIAAFGKLSFDPFRQALDFATVSALLAAVMAGTIFRHKRVVIVVAIIAVGFGLVHNLPTWFGYNSAMTPADVQALQYANGFKTFSSSDTVAHWIYSRYTKATRVGNEGEVVLMRNKPMTPRSTPGNVWFQKEGWTPDASYKLTLTFVSGDIVVQVYEVAK